MHGRYETQPGHRQGPWCNMKDLELVTHGWVDWIANRRLLSPAGSIPPAEAEETFYAQCDVLDTVVSNEAIGLRRNRGN